VHVFDGPVRARAIDTRGWEVGSIRLSASEAARLTTSAVSFSRLVADGDHFVRTLERSIGPSEGLPGLNITVKPGYNELNMELTAKYPPQ
jgi:hypothetical protein